MLVSLKKAHYLQRMAMEAAGRIDPKPAVAVSAYTKGDPVHLVKEAATTASALFESETRAVLGLIEASYTIRRLLGEANARPVSGQVEPVQRGGAWNSEAPTRQSINDSLAERAMIEAKEKRLAVMLQRATTQTGYQPDEMVGRIEHLRRTQESAEIPHGYRLHDIPVGREDMVVVSDEQIEMLRAEQAELRQAKAAITDELARLNLTTQVEIPDWVIKVLREHNLLFA